MFSFMKGCLNKYRNVTGAAACLCTALGLCINFDRPGFALDLFSSTVLFVALYCTDRQISKTLKYDNRLMRVASVIVACLWLVSKGFSIDNTTWSLHSSPAQIVKSVIYVIGMAHLINSIGISFHHLIVSKSTVAQMPFEKKHSFAAYFVLMLAVWLPHTVISHPASIECDVWQSLLQYFGREEFTAHHPPVFAVLIGWVVDFGRMVADINAAFFMWTMLQTFCCAAIMAYALHTMNLLKTPRWLVILSFITAAVSPFYTCYITTIVKDTMYSFAVMLYLIELVYMHIGWEKSWNTPLNLKHTFLYSLSNIVMILFRHNGKYIIYVTVAYLLVKCALNKEKLAKRCIARAAVMTILLFLLSKGFENMAVRHYQVTIQKGESMRESLSIPFQQSARYARYYANETPDEEKAVIDRVIDYYALADVYDPMISDPVKARFHYYATDEDWANYFKVWFKQFLKHPLTYFGATLNQNYGLIYPQKEISRFYYSTYVDYFYDHGFMDEMGAAQEMTFPAANNARIALYRLIHSMPITGALSNIAVSNIVLVYITIFAIHDRKKRALWITIPVILSDLVVMAGPAIYDNVRYALPVVYMTPIVLAYFIHVCVTDNETKTLV